MKLDVTRYEGHTPGPWTLCGHVGHYDPTDPQVLHKLSEADKALVEDAPNLLAHVKELDEEVADLKSGKHPCPYCQGHGVVVDSWDEPEPCPVCEERGTITFQEIYAQNERLVKDMRSMASAYSKATDERDSLLARVAELEATNAAMLADILACTAILDADKSHSLTMCDDCWHVLEKYILEDES